MSLSIAILSCATSVTAAGTEPKTVFIYIANENAPEGAEQENYDQILDWLESDGGEKAATVASSLNNDRRMFPRVVDLEVSLLTYHPEGHLPLSGLVVATNRLLRNGHCLISRKGDHETQKTELPFLTEDENIIVDANPASRSKILSQFLAFVAEQFDPATHRFIVVFKSHGSVARVLTPRLVVRATETSKEEILSLVNEEVAEDELPLWVDQLGVSRKEFLSLLATAGKPSQMEFDLVFLEACDATEHDFSLEALPQNVERLLFIKGSANYQDLLYEDILRQETDDVAQAMIDAASARFVLIDRNAPDFGFWTVRRILYLLPLITWLCCLMWRQKKTVRSPD